MDDNEQPLKELARQGYLFQSGVDHELLLTIARMLHRRLRDGWSTKWDDEDLAELKAILARYPTTA